MQQRTKRVLTEKMSKRLDFQEIEQEILRWKGFVSVFHSAPPESNLTPRKAIWKKNKLTLWHYPPKQKKYKTPIVLVYSIVNQPFILDLAPGASVIEGFVQEGYDVYLIDFGIPGYEDKDFTMNDYITKYIQKGVQRALSHSEAKEITLIGYCLGGTLAAMYTGIAKEPIKNLILTVAPFDFSAYPIFDQWFKALKNERFDIEHLVDSIGLIPAPLVEAGVRLLTSPIYYSPYLSLLNRAYDEAYMKRWQRFNNWTKSHIPFPGATLKQLLNDFVKENKLLNGTLQIEGENLDLRNIHSNLLVIASKYDRLVPEAMVQPIMDLVSSSDKTYHVLEAGHAGISLKGGLPPYFKEWIHIRSDTIDNTK